MDTQGTRTDGEARSAALSACVAASPWRTWAKQIRERILTVQEPVNRPSRLLCPVCGQEVRQGYGNQFQHDVLFKYECSCGWKHLVRKVTKTVTYSSPESPDEMRPAFRETRNVVVDQGEGGPAPVSEPSFKNAAAVLRDRQAPRGERLILPLDAELSYPPEEGYRNVRAHLLCLEEFWAKLGKRENLINGMPLPPAIPTDLVPDALLAWAQGELKKVWGTW